MIPVYLAKHLRQHTVRGCSFDRRICPVHNLAQHNPVLRPQLTQHTRSPHHNPAHNLVLRPQLSQLHALKKGLVTMRPGVNLLR